jgi:CubicO group peptidase (beta-lactamase class C family)
MKIISEKTMGAWRRVLLCSCWLTVAAVARAEDLAGSARLEAASLERWADTQFTTALAQKRYSGLVVAVVKQGELAWTKGYGYADWVKQTPVDPERTLFRIGSTSKVFAAMAVAQLMDRGQIASLDDPANKYLKRIQLPRAFGKDITLRHLLTHQAGFEDRAFGLGTEVAVPLQASAEDIRRALPRIVREPGTLSVYSNFGTALLGTLIEDVSGQPLADYYTGNLFGPLGMQRSYLNYDLRPHADLGIPYAFRPEGTPQPVQYVPMRPFIAPAGGISATATDMAKFMIAHLQAGADGQSSVLSPEKFRLMHTRLAGNHPAVSGFGMVFILGSWNGHPIIEHGGGWPGFETIMMMFPREQLGVFISIMGGEPMIGLGELRRRSFGAAPPAEKSGPPVGPHLSSTYVREALLTQLFGSYVPEDAAAALPPGPASGYVEYAGTYWRERRSYTTLEAVFGLLNAGRDVAEVHSEAEGTLRIGHAAGFRSVAPDVFWNDRAASTLADPESVQLFAFSTRPGQPSTLAPQLSVDVWKRASAFWNPLAMGRSLPWIFLLTITGLACLAWPASDRIERVTRWLPPLLLGLLITVPLTLLSGYAEGDGLPYALLMARPARFIGLAVLGNLIALIAIAMLLATWHAWRTRQWGAGPRAFARRVHYSVLTAGALALLVVLAFFNLVGWHLP